LWSTTGVRTLFSLSSPSSLFLLSSHRLNPLNCPARLRAPVLAVLVVLAALLLLSRCPALRPAPDVPVVLVVLAVPTAVRRPRRSRCPHPPRFPRCPRRPCCPAVAVAAAVLVALVICAALTMFWADSPRLDGAAGYSVVWKNGQSWRVSRPTWATVRRHTAQCASSSLECWRSLREGVL